MGWAPHDSTQTACTPTDRTPSDYTQLATHTHLISHQPTVPQATVRNRLHINSLHKADFDTAHDGIQPTSHQTTLPLHRYAVTDAQPQ